MKYVRCTFCKEISAQAEWKVDYKDCELCGSHKIETCPKCGDGDEGAYSFVSIEEVLKESEKQLAEKLKGRSTERLDRLAKETIENPDFSDLIHHGEEE